MKRICGHPGREKSAAAAVRRRSAKPVAAEGDLREQLEKVAAAAPGVICSFRLRPDGRMAMPYASPSILDLYGVRPEEVAGDFGLVISRVHPDDAPSLLASIEASARDMTQWHAEWRYDHPLKGERWIAGYSMPVRESDGSMLWHGFVYDITERKERERRIAELNAFLRLVTDAVPALISYVGTDLRYRMVNRSYERWFGCRAGDIEGRSAPEVLGAEAWARIAPYAERALAGESVAYETEVPYREGGTRWVQASYLPDVADDGRVRGFVAMVIDLTEHRRIEEELRRSRQMFVELMARHDGILEAERKHMAREIHDELGQLLTGMRLGLSALEMRGGKGRKPEGADIAGQLGRLLDEATSVVRRISANLRPVLLEHGLLPALEGLATEFRHMTGIACRLTVAGESRHIDEARSTAAFRIVQESLTNIARHAQARAVSVHVSFAGERLRLMVLDDGRGFDPAAALQSAASLGLFGMQERAAMAGGILRIDSAPGRGTRLELDLPREVRSEK